MNPIEHHVNLSKDQINGIIKLKESFYETDISRYSTEENKNDIMFKAFQKLYPEIRRLVKYSGMINGNYVYYFYAIYH